MNKEQCYRHGDVDLLPTKLPEGCMVAKSGEITIAEGEATGHHHTIYPEPGVIASLLLKDERRFLKIEKGIALLKHQEHGTLQLPPGVFEIGNEREHDYFENAMRKVVD